MTPEDAFMARATFNGTVFFDEANDSPLRLGGSRPNDSQFLNRTLVRKGIILSSDLDTLMAECFPDPPELPGLHPEVGYLYVSDVDCIGLGGVPSCDNTLSNVVNQWQYLECTITYTPLSYGANRVSRSATTSIEALPHMVHTLSAVTSSSADPVDSSLTNYNGHFIAAENIPAYHFVPKEQIQYQLENVPISHYTSIMAAKDLLIGHVNRDTWQDYEPETLLFEGVSENYATSPSGIQVFSLTLNFSSVKIRLAGHEDYAGRTVFGHNHLFVPDLVNGGGRYHYIVQRLYNKERTASYDPVDADVVEEWEDPVIHVRGFDPIFPLTPFGTSFDDLFFGTTV